MQPELSLDIETIAANARAWRTFAGVSLYAVVKANGYGWGMARLTRALEGVADAYCVADAEELTELRRHSGKRAIVLGSVEPDQLADVLRQNAAPTIATALELEIVHSVLREMGAPLYVRVGIRPAAAWSGISLEELRSFGPALREARAQVELWSHITDWDRRAAQRETLNQAGTFLREIGVNVLSTDVASTFALAHDGPHGTAVRVGIGLFGATGGTRVPGVRCALRVVAPVTHVRRHAPGSRVGYGGTILRMDETLATARCGYADGLPNALAGADDIVSIGMQYVTVRESRLNGPRTEVVLLDGSSDLDEFAARCGRLPHEIVTGFGNCARANGVSVEV